MPNNNFTNNNRYWFTGDLHLGHRNILQICGRPFKTIQEHDRILIDNHNSVVQDDDVVFNLGDVGFRCSARYIVDKLRLFKGKLVIILGNHDKALRQALKVGLLDKELSTGKIEIIGGNSAYDTDIAVSKMLNFDGNKIFISHYGHRTWPSAFRKAMHLYAHSHNNLASYYRSFDVGVDTETETHKKFYPWSLEEIIERMNCIKENFSEKDITSDIL